MILVFSQRPLARGRVKQSDFRAREGSSCVFAGCHDDLTSHLIRDLWLMSPYVLWEEETVVIPSFRRELCTDKMSDII